MNQPVAPDAVRLTGSPPVDDRTLELIDLAIAEDVGPADWTTRWTVPARMRAVARVCATTDGVVAGIGAAAAVFLRLDPRMQLEVRIGDGGTLASGDTLCEIRGPARALLTGERVALNFLQRLSGIATFTRRFVDAVAGTGTRILDTRKTTPGWRALEKAAVRAGGGHNHRAGLHDMVLIKENHIALAGGIENALARVRDQNDRGLPVEIEVRSLDELERALDVCADHVLLDNMDLDLLAKAVRRTRARNGTTVLEASGNITLERVRDVAATGVDFISVGALTHSAPALDLSLRIG